MKNLNPQATATFSQLLAKLVSDDNCTLSASGYMDLTFRVAWQGFPTEFGVSKWYSLAHYYEQNGDLMSDPKMVFIVVDNRNTPDDLTNLLIFPQMFEQDSIGCYQESIVISEDGAYQPDARYYSKHLAFAEYWLSNIEEQGFLQ